ncbi:MAG: glycosyltransferase family 4 protein [bacterium]|nr:glycosyltransferase family 4 protein [bacterium]
MKKILIFSLVYYPKFIGGAEVTIKEVTDRISPNEVEFDMITLRLDRNLPRYEKIGNINIYRIGWSAKQKVSSDSLSWYLHLNKYFFLILGPIKALELNRNRKYDAIWSLMATYNSFGAVFFKLLKPKIKFIFSLQDGDPISYIKKRALPLYPFFKMMFTKADHIQAISKFLANWAKEMGASCPVTVIPNAVDYDLFSKNYNPVLLGELASTLGKNANDTMLITTSRLVVKNAVADVISALKYLPTNVKFLILGQGYEEQNLRKLVAELKLESRVIFLGYVPHAEMPKYLQISDIFIRPSLSEGLGNSFLEAMVAGVPVIGTAVGGIPDFLRDGETGLFCEVNNPSSIAQKVEKLIKDKESREYIIKNGREMVEKDYRWEMISAKMKELFLC